MHEGVQRLDASVHDLGEACHIADIDDRDTRLTECLHCSARGDNLDSCFMQYACKFHHTRLVGYTDQSTFYLHNDPPSAAGRM